MLVRVTVKKRSTGREKREKRTTDNSGTNIRFLTRKDKGKDDTASSLFLHATDTIKKIKTSSHHVLIRFDIVDNDKKIKDKIILIILIIRIQTWVFEHQQIVVTVIKIIATIFDFSGDDGFISAWIGYSKYGAKRKNNSTRITITTDGRETQRSLPDMLSCTSSKTGTSPL